MSTVELMEDQVRAIYAVLTGRSLPEAEEVPPGAPPPTVEEVARKFAILEQAAREVPGIAEKVPPFSFSPPIDVFEDDGEVVIELAIPGVEAKDVQASIEDGNLVVQGVRPGARVADGRVYLHSEIPRGPFRRVIPLPARGGEAELRVEAVRGLIRVRVASTETGKSGSKKR